MSATTSLLVLLGIYTAIALSAPTTDTTLSSKLFERGKGGGCPQIQPGSGSQADKSYWNGHEGGCDIKNHLDDDGSCKKALQMKGNICIAYCEVRNTYNYGREMRFTEVPSCRADSECSFTTSKALTVTQSFSINTNVRFNKRDVQDAGLAKREAEIPAALKFGFDLGASYSYSVAKQTSTGLKIKRPEKSQDKCGYWTFVPIFWTSCGTMTTTTVMHNWYGGTMNCGVDYKTTPNYCNTYSYPDAQGNQAGETIFVLIDCKTQQLLDMEFQDPIYAKAGVAAVANVPKVPEKPHVPGV